MKHPDLSLAERLSAAARDLQAANDPQETMDAAVRLAVANVGGADEAGLSLVRRRKRIETPAYTQDVVLAGDRLQNELAEGPCHNAIWEALVIHSADLSRETRWRKWGPRVSEELGVQSMLCLRLFTNQDTVGGLNLYSRSDHAFTAHDRDDALALAAHISVAVAEVLKIKGLQAALDSRTVIGQAVGMLMERYGIDSDRASGVLQRVSTTTNRKLVSVAEEVVTTRRMPVTPGEEAFGLDPGG